MLMMSASTATAKPAATAVRIAHFTERFLTVAISAFAWT